MLIVCAFCLFAARSQTAGPILTRVSATVAFPWGLEQDAQLSQRDRAAGYVSFDQKWKTGTGRQYLRTL